MRSSLGMSDCQRLSGNLHAVPQACDEVGGRARRVTRYGQDQWRVRMTQRGVEPGKRAGKAGQTIADHGQTAQGVVIHVTVGIDQQPFELGLQARDNPVDQRMSVQS